MMTRGSGTVAVLSCLFSLSKPLAEKGKEGPIHFEFHLGMDGGAKSDEFSEKVQGGGHFQSKN